MTAIIVQQSDGLFAISIHGEIVEQDLTHADALRALGIYKEWELV